MASLSALTPLTISRVWYLSGSRGGQGWRFVLWASTANLQKQLDQRTSELAEARKQQTATSEVLRVIGRSPTDTQPVLDAVGENAARLCDANNAVIFRLEGDVLRQVASYGGIPTTSHPSEGLPVHRGRVTGRAVVERGRFTSMTSPQKITTSPKAVRMRDATVTGPRLRRRCCVRAFPLGRF